MAPEAQINASIPAYPVEKGQPEAPPENGTRASRSHNQCTTGKHATHNMLQGHIHNNQKA
jgi:hypothetical protein